MGTFCYNDNMLKELLKRLLDSMFKRQPQESIRDYTEEGREEIIRKGFEKQAEREVSKKSYDGEVVQIIKKRIEEIGAAEAYQEMVVEPLIKPKRTGGRKKRMDVRLSKKRFKKK